MERIGCRALVLACGGYGGNPGLVRAHVRALAGAAYHGHAGNTGDALLRAQALGAPGHCLSGAQGHGAPARPHGILITWALTMAGGIRIDARGRRFANEHRGYSDAVAETLAALHAIAAGAVRDPLGRDFTGALGGEAGARLSVPCLSVPRLSAAGEQ
jgi:fumarate reductase flavoprotein subunit